MGTFKTNEKDKLIFDQNHPTKLDFSPEQVQQIKEKLAFEKLTFFFIPDSTLRQLVVQDTHPNVKQFPMDIKTGIMLGNSITLKRDIVFSYLEKRLEEPWSFMLKHGEIRVREDRSIAFKGLVRK
jgi:hypothetical protein